MLKRKRQISDAPNGAPKRDRKGSAGSRSAPKPDAASPAEQAVSTFESGYNTVLRGLKKARIFEIQRLKKRVLDEKKERKHGASKHLVKRKPWLAKRGPESFEADATADASQPPNPRIERFEREIEILQTLDLEVAARLHLANVILRNSDLAEIAATEDYAAFAAHLHLASEVLSIRTKDARAGGGENDAHAGVVHNVTSSLYNQRDARDAVVDAVRQMCSLLGVPFAGLAKPKRKRAKDMEGEEQPWEGIASDDEGRPRPRDGVAGGDDHKLQEKEAAASAANQPNRRKDDPHTKDAVENEGKLEGSESEEEKVDADELDIGDIDDDEIERELAKFKGLIGNSSDEDEDDDLGEDDDGIDYEEISSIEGEDEGDEDSDDGKEGVPDGSDVAKPSRRKDQRIASPSVSASENESDSDSESDEDLAPRKRVVAATKGDSYFLPSLMGGYISGGDSDSDEEDGGGGGGIVGSRRRALRDKDEKAAERMLGAPRKNRRGQRARQAIWEMKYKAQAKHLQNEGPPPSGGKEGKETSSRTKKDSGWDTKRGAVDAGDGPRWLRRKMGKMGKPAPGSAAPARHSDRAMPAKAKANSNANANNQISGALHPSWEAARKAKEKAQTAPFLGKKVVFD